jgi:uncharacterized membrane protein YhhN
MSYTLLWIVLLVALATWLSIARRWKKLEYLAKPAVMVVLLLWLWNMGGFRGHFLWFSLGVVFSLAGDIFLMLPRDLFIPGLISFLLAHIGYLIGFNDTLPPVNVASLIIAAMVAVTAGRIYQRVAAGLSAKKLAALHKPVLAYVTAISLMVVSALLTLVRPEWASWPALLVSGGALLFFISDGLLAWDMFVAPVPQGNLKIIVAYHLGQMGIVLGAALHFLG